MTAFIHASHHAPPGDSAPGSALATDPVFQLHRGGKIEVNVSVPLAGRDDLSMAYTPGVARVCTAIAEQPELACTGVDELVETVAALAPSFGGINLEDISAPRCFEVEDRLRERLDIPVFHYDQHDTAIVTLAALRGAAPTT